jgi:hypothetical protein
MSATIDILQTLSICLLLLWQLVTRNALNQAGKTIDTALHVLDLGIREHTHRTPISGHRNVTSHSNWKVRSK